MAKKDDLKAELTKLGIKFEDTATNAELEALLPAGDPVLAEPEDPVVLDAALKVQAATTPSGLPSAPPTAPAAITHDSIEVGDPLVLRPVELPLVVKPAAGSSWKNKEQEAYAKILNGAAYSFPNHWKTVKDVEIARLVEIGNDPARYYFYTGTNPEGENLSYNNKLID